MNQRRATPLLAIALVLTAATLGTSVLYVPGFALLVASLTAWAWVRLACRGARLEVEPGPRTVVESDSYPLEVRARGGWLPVPGGMVTHPKAQQPVSIIPGGTARLEITSLQRGSSRISPPELLIQDPLGLAAARVRAVDWPRVLVLPRIEEPIPAAPITASADGFPAGRRSARGSGPGDGILDVEVDGLRAYRPGSPASRIHWPILARRGELTERRLVGGGGASPIVTLVAEPPVEPRALDRAVRAAGSLCFHLARASGCTLMLPGERAFVRIDHGLRNWPQAHARLALVKASGRPPEPRIADRPTSIFWVSATGRIPHLVPPLGATTYLVTPWDVDLVEPVFTVAGCQGYPLAAVQAWAEARAA